MIQYFSNSPQESRKGNGANRAFSSWPWIIFITCCGNRVLYAESSKLGKLTSEILNDLQLIVRSYEYLNICNPPLKMNG